MSRLLLTLGLVVVTTAASAMSCKHRATPHAQRGSAPSEQAARTNSALLASVRDGDLIFQESTSGQSEMVRALTRSRWTHMGVILKKPAGIQLVEVGQ